MKQGLSAIVLLLTLFVARAQFGIQERIYLDKKEDTEMISLLVKGELEEIKASCKKIEANYKYGYKNIAAVSVPKSNLNEFYDLLGTSKMEIPLAKGTTLMDTALIHNRITNVHAGISPLLQAYKGSGVIIGILDSGIYFEHDDFKNADGTTRIRYIWDQNVASPTNPPAPYNFGQEWNWQEINNGACNHVEPANQYGHGTTVAGAACGNGLATGGYIGVAPECDIIAVAMDYYSSDFLINTVDAIDYVFKKADALGKPCVINTSFGSYSGSHDGKDFATQIIEALLEERAGRSIVASAGNGNNLENTNPNFIPPHLSYTLSSDTNFTWFKTMPSGQLYFSLWADTANFSQAHFTIGANNDTSFLDIGQLPFMTVNSFPGNLSNGVYLSDFVYDNNGVNQGQVEMYLEQYEGLYNLEYLITPSRTQDLWRFVLTGSGTFDIWSSRSFQGSADMVFSNLPPNFVYPPIDYYKLPDNEKCIVGYWQCSDKVITVGNFANRSHYYDVDSVYRDLNLTPGEIYYKSSEGPTRDNRLKPDISSTGNIVFASGNLDYIASALNINRPKVAPGAKHNYNGGTSMSSPIVAGAVALYLEKNPNAWWYEIKEALQQTARKDTFTGLQANVNYGHGKLDAFALMQFEAVLGCTDDTMFNYNPNANVDDGSCVPVVLGCTDSLALNFNSEANTNDGSCIPVVLGCTDSLALNYNPSANVDDGSCTYETDTTGMREQSETQSIRIIPNPASNDVVLHVSSNQQGLIHSLIVRDILGRQIDSFTFHGNYLTFDISGYSKGIYQIELFDGQVRIGQQKMIKK